MNSSRPVVSCVLATCDRPAFVAQAVRYFLRQDYRDRELLVVDTGQVPACLPGDPRIRHLRPGPGLALGAARNLGCVEASGELLAHWDDDDWIGPDRLSRQVDAIQRRGADACGLASLLYYRPRHGDAWRYTPAAGDRPFLGGGTLLFRRRVWARSPFPEIDVGEDAAFVAAIDPARLLALHDDRWYVALLHDSNHAPKNLADPRWSPASLDEVARRIGPDRSFYGAVRAGRLERWRQDPAEEPGLAADGPAAGPAGPPPAAHAVTLAGDLLVYDGLGSMAEYAALGLARAGVDVRLAPIRLDTAGLAATTVALLAKPPGEGPLLYWSWPRPELRVHLQRPELFIRVAWESSRLPADWPALLNRARALVVPSTSVADACRASGVTVPLVVVPDGVDPAVHGYQRRPERAGTTTLAVGTLIARKHLAEAVAAWRRAFGDDPGARLLIKARFRAGHLASTDPRIRVVDSEEPTRGLAHWYRHADVLLALGNEGFGLPLVEAMATGLPVIALDSEGQADVCRQAGELVLSVPPKGFAPFDDPRYGRCGVAAIPDVDAIAARLRWVATHPGEARDLGRAASRWALGQRNVWTMGPAVLDVMERHARPPRPLRRPRTLWVSSWQRRCGVGEYTAELVRALPGGVQVTAGPPARHGLRMLHVQHEDGLFDDATLARHLEAVDAPVIVTEHSVWPHARPWERRADVLAALTDHGAAMLRARAGGRRVVRLSHGCPDWFPPRKAARGRVIGSFGFLERHKGLFRLLDVVRALPGSELVLYSHVRTAAAGRDFARAAEGLPVRWTDAFLPTRTVARRLAAECDVLVFWYDEVPHASTSGAARVGLATGVPVLTSPTGWFADLHDVTYQPPDVVEGVRRLLDDSSLRASLAGAARDFCAEHAWRRVAADHLTLWQSVERP